MKFDRITIDPEKMNGQPCIRNMRLTVQRVVRIVAMYSDKAELFREYPELEEEDIQQALFYAAESLDTLWVQPSTYDDEEEIEINIFYG
jgi:uncharacterized protein (DUF433 family)